MGQFRPLFVYFRYFLDTISIIEKSVDGVLGIRTRGRRMVGADETTELWRPPMFVGSVIITLQPLKNQSHVNKIVRLFVRKSISVGTADLQFDCSGLNQASNYVVNRALS